MRRLLCLTFMLCGLAPLAFAARSESGTARFMQGPMAGAVTHDSITVWVRASGEFEVSATFEPVGGGEKQTVTAMPKRENDLAVTLTATGLQPATRYTYSLKIDGKLDSYQGKLAGEVQTAPTPGAPANFRVAFGSCAREQRDPEQPIWNTVGTLNPDLFFWLGDNIYGDSLVPETLAEEYQRQLGLPILQPLLRNVPQLAVWDDHDFGLNDHDRTNPVKDDALRVFKNYWANPAYGLPDAPGVFFRYAYGAVDFFFLDGRYYRDPNEDPSGPAKTFLGEKQLAWLKQGLKESEATFKVLVCGSGWTAAKGDGGDSWAAFLHERDTLFDFIRDEAVGGVVLLSGDTHCGELNAIPWSERGGYDLYDLVSSPLAQLASNKWRERTPEVRLRPGVEEANVGYLEFDFTGDVPTLTFNLYTADGKPAWEPFVLHAVELQNGVTSHASKDTYDEAASKR